MNAETWKQVDISDETEELVKASIAPSTIQTYRRAVQTVGDLAGWAYVE